MRLTMIISNKLVEDVIEIIGDVGYRQRINVVLNKWEKDNG
jgi:hypothetical protein